MTTVIVGGGVMGEAILAAALETGAFSPEAVTIVEKLPARREQLAAAYGVTATESFAPVGDAELVLLCVKPQDKSTVHGSLRADAVLVSVMAGVTIDALRRDFAHEAVVRVMPNTPAAIRAGMSVWTATSAVSAQQRERVGALLRAIGQELYVDDETKIDMATAVNGSGPAYVFMFIEAMVEGAVAVGLPRAAAEQLVLQTLLGSVQYAKESGRQAADLRAAVTSPAGTTAAGLLELEKGAFRATIIECVRAAHARAVEMGKA